jgi:hypothetical protein
MPLIEPAIKRAVAFIDGQNLFHHSRGAFGYSFPNFDIRKLVDKISADQHWNLVGRPFLYGRT